MQPSALTERARGLMVGIAAGNLLGVCAAEKQMRQL